MSVGWLPPRSVIGPSLAATVLLLGPAFVIALASEVVLGVAFVLGVLPALLATMRAGPPIGAAVGLLVAICAAAGVALAGQPLPTALVVGATGLLVWPAHGLGVGAPVALAAAGVALWATVGGTTEVLAIIGPTGVGAGWGIVLAIVMKLRAPIEPVPPKVAWL